MKIAVGCDHAGYPLKEAILRALKKMNHTALDCGSFNSDSVDYPLIAADVARAVSGRRAAKGVLLCGTGIGVSMAANRFPGVLAAVVWSAEIARMASEHNHANVLCLPCRFLSLPRALACLRAWLGTRPAGGRHLRRVRQILRLDGRKGTKKS